MFPRSHSQELAELGFELHTDSRAHVQMWRGEGAFHSEGTGCQSPVQGLSLSEESASRAEQPTSRI